MRISIRIASNQDCWHPRFPTVDLAKCYPKDASGNTHFNESEFIRQISAFDYVMLSDKDSGTPMAFAAVLIASVNEWLEDNGKDVDADPNVAKISSRLNRNLKRGSYSFVRLDITGVRVVWKGKTVRGAKVRITTNDNDVFERHPFEHDFAMILADFCRCYSNLYVSRGEPAIVFAPETQALLNDLHELTTEKNEADRDRTRQRKPQRIRWQEQRWTGNGGQAGRRIDTVADATSRRREAKYWPEQRRTPGHAHSRDPRPRRAIGHVADAMRVRP